MYIVHFFDSEIFNIVENSTDDISEWVILRNTKVNLTSN